MGNLELGVLLKYGIPLVVKLLAAGKKEEETVKAVTTAIVNLDGGVVEVREKLLAADDEQARGIVEGMFRVLMGVVDGVFNLAGALVGLLFKD